MPSRASYSPELTRDLSLCICSNECTLCTVTNKWSACALQLSCILDGSKAANFWVPWCVCTGLLCVQQSKCAPSCLFGLHHKLSFWSSSGLLLGKEEKSPAVLCSSPLSRWAGLWPKFNATMSRVMTFGQKPAAEKTGKKQSAFFSS